MGKSINNSLRSHSDFRSRVNQGCCLGFPFTPQISLGCTDIDQRMIVHETSPSATTAVSLVTGSLSTTALKNIRLSFCYLDLNRLLTSFRTNLLYVFLSTGVTGKFLGGSSGRTGTVGTLFLASLSFGSHYGLRYHGNKCCFLISPCC
ncbi:hypothetical protein AVEN_193804-1 [Araneus ventricosus]|uniref:Uncharacterized protein n=1 Tax=Araneus ventricosus TaxID=182803 RepID=A0A4Y2VIX8_ARAVE|nr:hypothetical protein AVEN_193804-1 [Araneus ventricosus]